MILLQKDIKISYKLETEALAAWWLSACGEVVSRTGGNRQQLLLPQNNQRGWVADVREK
jgi:hypothetical protein